MLCVINTKRVEGKSKTVRVTVRGGFETSRLPHCLDSRLTDSGKFVSLTHRRALLSETQLLY
jgi:hypothetical protein